jgi:predicted transcriptional regulator
MTTKDAVRALLDRLPEGCSLDDVQYHLCVLQALARGEADIAEGRTVPHLRARSRQQGICRRWRARPSGARVE